MLNVGAGTGSYEPSDCRVVAQLDEARTRKGLARLERDLADGSFWTAHADLRERTSVDLGYRLLVAGPR